MRRSRGTIPYVEPHAGYTKYGHFTVGNRYTDLLVTDGYYYPEGWETSGHGGGDWLCVLHVDWVQGTIGAPCTCTARTGTPRTATRIRFSATMIDPCTTR
ncbi:hypothetical protein OB236_20150 [Paenibacillus sp. WQ 127069]|uniref:Uncharacterized protein n=1 Tax=Paenibacillus baimaensis TaxID=2982185 RepID=A0ABT2UIG9_9BACL|nr:hypothetical protein [Paenibacillus sp. WQ 127069]MCU6794423.1 hypothetical protein [Paenibacillus sp. WQ 127069]